MNIQNLNMQPVGYDKEGPYFSAKDTSNMIVKLINTDEHFERIAKTMTPDIDKAEARLNDAMDRFQKKHDIFKNTEKLFIDEAKKVSSAVKDAEEKLLQGLARVEKAANFERLNKYVELLERTASAMNQLAALEKEGKLDKIASAIR